MFKPKTAKTLSVRSRNGSLVAVIPAAILLAIVGIGAFAMDISHNVTVRTELQSATDAAALSGARDLLLDNTMTNAPNDALTVAAENTADGVAVSNGTPGTSVTESDQFDTVTQTGTVTVDGSRQIKNMFSSVFGHPTDTVNAHSVAEAYRTLVTVYPNQTFPLMVSLDTVNGNPVPLYQLKVGDTFTLYINSQQYKNAAWTGLTNPNTNAAWLQSAIDQMFGFAPMQAGFVPQVSIGDTLNMGNGVSGEKSMAGSSYQNVLMDPNTTLVLPVMSGDPPYNQSKQAVGFVTVHPNSIAIDQAGGKVMSINVTVVRTVVKGVGGPIPSSTIGNVKSQGMTTISAGTVKLIT
jgi:hypothetical protein